MSGPVFLLRLPTSEFSANRDKEDAKKPKTCHQQQGWAGQGRTSHSRVANGLVQICGFQTCLHMGMTCGVNILLLPEAHQKCDFIGLARSLGLRTL